MRALPALCLALAAVACRAGGLEPGPDAMLACLQPPAEQRPAVVYPPLRYERKEGGTVRVEMHFFAPDEPPRVRVVAGDPEPARELVEAVEAHLRALRMPCLPPGSLPVRVKQEFVFVPNDGRKVVWTTPRRDEPSATFSCLTHVRPGSQPAVANRLWTDGVTQNVLLNVRFVAPDREPEVAVLVPAPARGFTEAAVEWARGHRLPCLAGEPVQGSQHFRFALRDGPRKVLTDMQLVTFLRNVRELGARPVFFDFTTMGCPFEVRLQLWRPHRLNGVGEIGATEPARRPFLDWLGGLELRLSPKDLNTVLGDSTNITVPCGTLDL